MKKKFTSLLLLTTLMMPTVSALASTTTPNDTIYYKYNNIDLQDLDIKLDENGEIISKIKDNSRSLFNLKQKNVLDEAVKNDEVEKTIKENLNDNKAMLGLSYTECYVSEKVDENGEIESKLLTVDEVNEMNRASVNPGDPEKRGKLTLVSNLITDSNLVGKPNTYSFSANAAWDVSGFNSNGEASPAAGDDFIGLCWPSVYQSNGTYVAKGTYNNGNPITMYKSSVVGDRGIVWAFQDQIPSNYIYIGAKNISAAAQIVPQSTKTQLRTFTAEYVHTYEKKNASVSINVSTTGGTGGLSVSNIEKQWTIVSPVTITVK